MLEYGYDVIRPEEISLLLHATVNFFGSISHHVYLLGRTLISWWRHRLISLEELWNPTSRSVLKCWVAFFLAENSNRHGDKTKVFQREKKVLGVQYFQFFYKPLEPQGLQWIYIIRSQRRDSKSHRKCSADIVELLVISSLGSCSLSSSCNLPSPRVEGRLCDESKECLPRRLSYS